MSPDQIDQESNEAVTTPASTKDPRVVTYDSSVADVWAFVSEKEDESGIKTIDFIGLPFWRRRDLRIACEEFFTITGYRTVTVVFCGKLNSRYRHVTRVSIKLG